MARVSVYVPDELEATVRERLPGVNRSEVLQRALRALLGCEHSAAVCADCGEPVSISGAEAAALDGFYSALLEALEEPVLRGATAEGAARVAKEVARRWRVPAAERLPLPRPTRAERRAARVRELPEPGGRTSAPAVSPAPSLGRATA